MPGFAREFKPARATGARRDVAGVQIMSHRPALHCGPIKQSVLIPHHKYSREHDILR